MEVLVSNGDAVQAGQPLVRLRDLEAREQLSQARSSLEIARAQLQQTLARLEAQRNQLNRLAATHLARLPESVGTGTTAGLKSMPWKLPAS